MVPFASSINAYFKLEERGSTIEQEIRAGISCFLTMSYILLVNPQLLSKLGIPATDIVVSTAIAAGFGSLICGLFGNLPFGLAPGVGLSAYLTYGLVLGDGLSIKQAFTSCFVAGVILLILTVTGVASIIMNLIPHAVKIGTIVGMGMQIALVGMTSVDLIVSNNMTLVALGDVYNYKVWMTLGSLCLIGSLIHNEVKGGILIGIFITSLLTWITYSSFPTTYVQIPTLTMSIKDYISFHDFDWRTCVSAVLAFVFIGIIDVSGVVFGMASLANLVEADGQTIPGSVYAFLGVSGGTIVGAACGSTPVIVYVESAAGIEEGGRTGLTAVVISIFFGLSLFFAPLFGAIPVTATAPVSILVGVLMMSQAVEINWKDMTQAIPAFLTMTMIPFTFSITDGILFGLFAATVMYMMTGQFIVDIKQWMSYQRARDSQRQQWFSVPGLSSDEREQYSYGSVEMAVPPHLLLNSKTQPYAHHTQDIL